MLNYVNSFKEAEDSPVLYGDALPFFDANNELLYIKMVDQMGKKTMCTYEIKQIENPKPLSSADFVPRAQFDALNQKMDLLMQMLTSPSQPSTDPQSFQGQSEYVQPETPMVTEQSGRRRGGNNNGQ